MNEEGDSLDFGKGIKLSQKDDMIFVENQKSKLKRFVTTTYASKEKLSVQKREISKNGSYSVIYMEQHKKYLVVDEETYNSTYFKLFVLEEFDKRFFEPVTLTPLIKVYKLKI
jgi:dolichyl-diphosphooligosaccharide--protein glycosyltransferase/undecaprenyl-diphosphooligosaccharide--protein glycosyltransferase